MEITDRTPTPGEKAADNAAEKAAFIRGLGFWDCTTMVAGSMIGSGIFIVSADMSRQLGSSGWLLAAWAMTGVLTLAAALSYGELAAMMPQAGGMYVYLREAYSPLWGFLYGWTLFLVIQTGTIAAVAVAFARFLGVLLPSVSATAWIVEPIRLSPSYAVSLSTQQLMAILLILVLTYINTRGLELGRWIQNVFTSAKTLALLALILASLILGWNADAVRANFTDLWTPGGAAAGGGIAFLTAFCAAQVGSLFSADSWHSITFAAGEVRDPQRNLPRALAVGAGLVIGLYLLANVGYLVTLTLPEIQNAADDRVGTAVLRRILPRGGEVVMAAAILVSTFGCNNGLILAGARVYFAMARDGLFFRPAGALNSKHVPAAGLVLQGLWASILVLPRTIDVDARTGATTYGNLYGNLLNYVVFSVLIFYVLAIAGIFVLRRKRPDAVRPYRAVGYPFLPLAYIVLTCVILSVLLVHEPETTGPGLGIVLSGIPVYYLWQKRGSPGTNSGRKC